MKKILLSLMAISIAYLIIISTPAQNAIWGTLAFLDPGLSGRMDKEWSRKPNEYLLRKLRANNIMEPPTAAGILIDRKDRALVPIYLQMLYSYSDHEKGTAMEALAAIGPDVAIEPLMKIMRENKDRNFKIYKKAVLLLAELKHVEIISEIKKIAETKIKNSEIPQDNAIQMCEYFGNNPDTIKILRMIASYEPIKGYEWLSASKQAEAALKRISDNKYSMK